MKVYNIPCHDLGHIYVVVVLQSCTDSLRVLPTSSEPFPTSSNGTFDVSNIKIEEDVDVIEESFTAIKEETDIGIKQEESPEAITSPDIKSEPDEVSYLCVCLFLDTFFQCPEISVFMRCQYFWPIETAPLLEMNNFFCHAFLVVVCRLEVLNKMCLSAWNCREDENTFLYPCRKNHYPQDVP
jgi:hypothetical protein